MNIETPPPLRKIPTLPKNLKESWRYIQSDYYRYCGHFPTVFQAIIHTLRVPQFGFLFWLRLSASKGWHTWIARFMRRRYSNKYGIIIFPSTRIGYGFFIAHQTSCVVNVSTIIGNNCSIYQYASIGSAKLDAAVIGENVYIGPNVNIVENVHIGSGATIGAGAVVVKDVPEAATVAGVPAKVISYKEPGRLIVNPFPLSQYSWHID